MDGKSDPRPFFKITKEGKVSLERKEGEAGINNESSDRYNAAVRDGPIDPSTSWGLEAQKRKLLSDPEHRVLGRIDLGSLFYFILVIFVFA